MGKLRAFAVLVLTGMVFLCTAPDSTAGPPCPNMTMVKEIPYELVYPDDPADQVVAGGTCKDFELKATLEGDSQSITIDIEGQGFHFEGEGNPTSITISGSISIRICTTVDSCGSGILKIGDVEIGSVRSDEGAWYLVSEDECVIGEDPDGPITSYVTRPNQYSIDGEKIRGKGKQWERISKGPTGTLDCECDNYIRLNCTLAIAENQWGKRCLAFPAMPYDGGYPCANPHDNHHWTWCGCVDSLQYREFKCYQ